MTAVERRHDKLAADCWRMIKALMDPAPMRLKREEDLDATATWLIEMACETAVRDRDDKKGTDTNAT